MTRPAEVVLSSATTMRAAHRLYALRGFIRRPELDRSPESGVERLGFALPLGPALSASGSTAGR